MAHKLSAPAWAFAAATIMATLASPASAQTVYEDAYAAPATTFTVGPRFGDVRGNPDLTRDNRAFFYGGAYGAGRYNSDPHSAAGTGGGAGGEGGSGGITESPAE